MGLPMKPLATTLRIVEWDELPASARDVPEGFDPLDEGVLMKHQRLFLSIKCAIKVCPKGRRTGITFAEALDDTITAASRKSAGGDNVFYIGDTKEKGLEFIGYCAKFARIIASAQQQGVSDIEEFLFEDQDERGNSRQITSYRIRFSSGFQVCALSSSPANIRGLQGKVVIDEAAFHKNVQAVLDAATALLIWGGQIVVISSHNGKGNPFNQLVKDVEAGIYGDDAKVFTVTFDEAVGNGLYERVCMMKGWTPSVQGKREWYEKVRRSFGNRKAAMREELDAIPRDGNGICIPGIWIEQAQRRDRAVLRLVLSDDFVKKSLDERKSYIDDWISRYLDPELNKLNKKSRHVFGQDFARHRNFSVIVPGEITAMLERSVPFMIELHNVPTRQQEQILWHVIRGLPRFCGGSMDATGSGETIAEYTGDHFGQMINQIKLNRNWYGTWMPKLIEGFEQQTLTFPMDENLADDVRAIQEVSGIPMIVKLENKDLKDPDLARHGDFGVGLCMMWHASLNLSAPIEFSSTNTRASLGAFDGEPTRQTDHAFGTVSGNNDFQGFV